LTGGDEMGSDVADAPTSSETREVEWVARGRVDALAMVRSMRLRIEHWASVVVDAVSAVGTLGAFAVGFVLFRREHHRQEARAEDQRRSLGPLVNADGRD
jgi:hypothetical protein